MLVRYLAALQLLVYAFKCLKDEMICRWRLSNNSFQTKGKQLRACQIPLDYKGSKKVYTVKISQEDTIKNHPVQELLYMLLFLIKPFETSSGVIFIFLLVCVWSSCCLLSIYHTFFSMGRSPTSYHKLSFIYLISRNAISDDCSDAVISPFL